MIAFKDLVACVFFLTLNTKLAVVQGIIVVEKHTD